MRRLAAVFVMSFFIIGAACAREVRQPAVAGAFYPADPAALSKAVEGYMSQAQKIQPEGVLVALVAPHAGYEFSGGVAAWSFAQVSGSSYDTVIVIGPTHRFGFKGASVYTGDFFATPLGEIPVDKAMAMSFLDAKSDIVYEPRAHEKEHSLEVEMPFLQKALKGFKVVPIVVGDPTQKSMERLSVSIARALEDKGKKALLVVSTDWSHYHDYGTAVKMDWLGIQTVSKLSSFELYGRAERGETELCGIYPMMLALDVANRLGADTARLYRYANSGDVTGDKRSVVGYAAMGIYRTGRAPAPLLSEPQKERLLKVARETVESYVRTKNAPRPAVSDPALSVPRGAFVTLKEDSRLRGCIGDFFSSEPLYETVRDMAIEACSHDGRFMPVTADELPRIQYEISVISPLRRVSGVEDIKVGRDGLYIIKGGRAGVLLPQVPVEQRWDRVTFLAETCIKAGLPPDAWKEGADIYVFTAEAFGEK
jgi:AmmeMemoRadiSam system protein B/AmmeMemoRadiSam system protein A